MKLNRYSAIFRPIRLGNAVSKNRIEVAPAGCFLTAKGGGNSFAFMEYVKSLSESGAGIVMMGISSVDEKVNPNSRILNVGSEGFIHDLSEIAELIHSRDALAGIELVCTQYMHAPPQVTVNETSLEDINEIFRLFAQGAERCAEAGFDMIMIHGGHGNVPAMFFSRMHNKRTDRYGGSFENRSRFALDLLDAIRAKVGNSLAIEYRISAEELIEGGSELEETVEFAKLIQNNVDMIHVSRGLLEEDELLPYMFPPAYLPRAINLDAATAFKKALHIPVSVVGAFDLELAEEAVASGQVDMVAMVRTVLADTNCVENARRGLSEKTRPCVRCNSCIHSTHALFRPIRCAVNPLIGRETEYINREPRHYVKKLAVIGGGPGGLEAARTAAKRGHRVLLFEKSDKLGGALNMASSAVFKHDMQRYLDWSVRTVIQNPNIEVRLNCEATGEMIRRESVDAIIVAVGAKPVIPDMPSDKTGKACWVGDIVPGKIKEGECVVVAGAGFTGLEAALSLALEGKQVTVIDMLEPEKIGADGITIYVTGLKKLLRDAGVKILCPVKLVDVNETGAVISDDSGNRTIPCDTVVLSLGVKPDREQAEELALAAAESYIIGDCSYRGGTLWRAVHSGFDAAMRL